jgi:signal transduction histidine kinase
MIQQLVRRSPAVDGRGRDDSVRYISPDREPPQPSLNELLGTVAHELRSPLAAVIGALRLIASESDPGRFAGPILAGMEIQLRHAMWLVDDLFDLCAGGLGKLSLRKQIVTLDEIVERATQSASRLLAERRHRLTVALPPERVVLEADPLRLTQVLTNLLSNAAKFTESGGHIRLIAAVEAGQIVIRVRDNGRGIAPDKLARVFDLFEQLPAQAIEKNGGLGIGLALVKSLVELHGGSVTAASDGPGTGSEFIVRIPVCADRSC